MVLMYRNWREVLLLLEVALFMFLLIIMEIKVSLKKKYLQSFKL